MGEIGGVRTMIDLVRAAHGPCPTASGIVDDHSRGGFLFLVGGVGRPAPPEPRPGVQGQTTLRFLLVRSAAEHGEALVGRPDATTRRAADAGVEPDGHRVGSDVGQERRGRQVRVGVAVDVPRATCAADATSGARGRRDAYDLYDMRGQGYRVTLWYHHVRRVSDKSFV